VFCNACGVKGTKLCLRGSPLIHAHGGAMWKSLWECCNSAAGSVLSFTQPLLRNVRPNSRLPYSNDRFPIVVMYNFRINISVNSALPYHGSGHMQCLLLPASRPTPPQRRLPLATRQPQLGVVAPLGGSAHRDSLSRPLRYRASNACA
jgi:hypothetical protein